MKLDAFIWLQCIKQSLFHIMSCRESSTEAVDNGADGRKIGDVLLTNMTVLQVRYDTTTVCIVMALLQIVYNCTTDRSHSHTKWSSAVSLRCFDNNNTHLMALFLGLPGWASIRKVKPIWIYWSKRYWVAMNTFIILVRVVSSLLSLFNRLWCLSFIVPIQSTYKIILTSRLQ